MMHTKESSTRPSIDRAVICWRKAISDIYWYSEFVEYVNCLETGQERTIIVRWRQIERISWQS